MTTIVNIAIMLFLTLSIFLNYAFIMRIHNHDAVFYLDKTDLDDIKPVLKFDLDEVEKKNFFVVKVLKDKDSGDKKRD